MKRPLLNLLSLFLVCAIAFSLVACHDDPEADGPTVDLGDNGEGEEKAPVEIKTKNRVFYEGYFNTVCTVYDFTGSANDEWRALCADIEEATAYFHRIYDIYNEYTGLNNIATLNKNAGGEPIKVDQEIINLLKLGKELYEKTDGHCNIAMGSVLSIWHNYREEGIKNPEAASLPSADELRAAAEHTSIDGIIIDEAASTVRLLDPEMSLDVGAIAKGYATEKIAEMLEGKGLSGYALDYGGNIRVIGEKPSGDGMTVGIINPVKSSSERYVRYVTLKDCALVTSGGYERYYTVDGANYHHIINKDTLMPENKYLSVTVKIGDSGMADALSTAVFNMELDEISELLEKLPGAEITLVMPNGEVKIME